MDRLDFDEYFMRICDIVASRATCPRKNVGAIIVKDNKIISTGYNGSPRGFKHCMEIGCLIRDDRCVRSVHAEQNAIIFAGKETNGAILYCNVLPCENCMKLIIQSGINKVVYKEDYNMNNLKWLFSEMDIEVIKYGQV